MVRSGRDQRAGELERRPGPAANQLGARCPGPIWRRKCPLA